jgi:acetolactate synthase-1/2/3 large subunit
MGFFGKTRELACAFTDPAGKLYSADYAAMARSMGAAGVTVEKPGDLAPQLEAAIASNRPTVLDVRVERNNRQSGPEVVTDLRPGSCEAPESPLRAYGRIVR